MAKSYEVLISKRVHGPFTAKEIRQLAREAKISEQDFVRYEGDPRWTRAGDVPNLFRIDIPAEKQTPPPPPPSPVARIRGAVEQYCSYLARHPFKLACFCLLFGGVSMHLLRSWTAQSIYDHQQAIRDLSEAPKTTGVAGDFEGDMFGGDSENQVPLTLGDLFRERAQPDGDALPADAESGVQVPGLGDARRAAPALGPAEALYPSKIIPLPGVLDAKVYRSGGSDRLYLSANNGPLVRPGSGRLAQPWGDAVAGIWNPATEWEEGLFVVGPRINGYEQIAVGFRRVAGEPPEAAAAVQVAEYRNRGAIYDNHYYTNATYEKDWSQHGAFSGYSETDRPTGNRNGVGDPTSSPVGAVSFTKGWLALSRVSAEDRSKFELSLYDLASKNPIRTTRGEGTPMAEVGMPQFARLGFSPDGSQLAGYTPEGELYIFDVPSLKPVLFETGLAPGVASSGSCPVRMEICFSSDGRRFLSYRAENNAVVLFDIARREAQNLELPAAATAFCFSRDGSAIRVLCAAASKYYEIDPDEPRIDKFYGVAGLYGWSQQVGFSQEGRGFFVQNHDRLFLYDDYYARPIAHLPPQYLASVSSGATLESIISRGTATSGPEAVVRTDRGQEKRLSLAQLDSADKFLTYGSLAKFSPTPTTVAEQGRETNMGKEFYDDNPYDDSDEELWAGAIGMLEVMNDPSLSAWGDDMSPEERQLWQRENRQAAETLLDGAPPEVRQRFGLSP